MTLENSSPKKLLQTKSAFLSLSTPLVVWLLPVFQNLNCCPIHRCLIWSQHRLRSLACPLDPIPTKLLTDYVDVLLPPITKIINLSLDSGHFPRTWKCALVRPVLRKDGLPPVFKNFRPVSNLPFISKLVETVVAKQLQHYLNCNNLFPEFYSAYRQTHSTETALNKVMNDILLNMNNQRVALLILLDLSAAFDTVDHMNDTMLLEYSFGIQRKALSWFASYLSGRIQRIMIHESLSKSFEL